LGETFGQIRGGLAEECFATEGDFVELGLDGFDDSGMAMTQAEGSVSSQTVDEPATFVVDNL
jgi:hypothetical protein